MIEIRDERPEDVDRIASLTTEAFAAAPHSDGTEAEIVARLRRAGALAVSLVALEPDLIGHVAFSPVTIEGAAGRWYGLGPISVRPDRRRRGVGGRFVREGLDRLAQLGADGCVVLGDPLFYRRFGFESARGLRYGSVPEGYVLGLTLSGRPPRGEVVYHPAFGG